MIVRTETLFRRAILRVGIATLVGIALALGGGAAAIDAQEPEPRDSADWTVLQDESVLAVVTRRAGAAARLAHDHLIHAARFDSEIDFDPDAPLDTRARARVHVAGLQVDDPGVRADVQGRLVELGLLDEPFQDIGSEDRSDVRAEMLHPDQLDAPNHPVIEFETDVVTRDPAGGFPFRVEVFVRIRGEEVAVPLSARVVEQGQDRVRIEAWGETRFTDFGIEPYSAFLGAVKNRDEFYLYLDLVLEEEP